MKEFIEKNVEWFTGLLKKYGLLVVVCLIVYWGIKRVWFWLVMPILCLIFLKNFLRFDWAQSVNNATIIASWVFVFSLLSVFFRKILKCED